MGKSSISSRYEALGFDEQQAGWSTGLKTDRDTCFQPAAGKQEALKRVHLSTTRWQYSIVYAHIPFHSLILPKKAGLRDR